jgi:hypothetical protein
MVMAVLILEQPGRVVKVSGAGRSFTRQPLLPAFTTVPGNTRVSVIVWACRAHIHADVSYPHTLIWPAQRKHTMQPLLKDYLDGTLASEGPLRNGTVTVANSLDVPVVAGFLATDGAAYPGLQVPALSTVPGTRPVNWYWLVWALDGSLAAVFEGAPPQANSLSIRIGPADLPSPGDIGPVPVPSS